MRLAAILATERGIRVCAPIHDAFLIEAPTPQIEAVAVEMQQAMREASRIVLGGLELRSDIVYVHSPDRYSDERGAKMWNCVMELIDELESVEKTPCQTAHQCAVACGLTWANGAPVRSNGAYVRRS